MVERKHRHIVEIGLTFLHHASLPLSFWDFVFTTAVYLINRLPTTLNFVVPYTVLFNKSPDYSFLRTFGCACFPFLRPYTTHKLDFRSQECLFMGYSNTQNSAPSQPYNFGPENSVSSENSNSNSESTSESSKSTESPPRTVNNHPMQTRSKSGIHNPRLHPCLFLAHW